MFPPLRHAQVFLALTWWVATSAASLPQGAALLRAGKLVSARPHLTAAVVAAPSDALARFALGSLEWKSGNKDAALTHWKAGHDLDTNSDAGVLLQKVAPWLASSISLVTDLETLQKILAFEQDFRRQREIEQALADFATRKAIQLRVEEGNSDVYLEFLVKKGYLERAGGPPSGRGKYITDSEGGVASTVFGSWEKRTLGPRALSNPAGWTALPALLVKALQTGLPGAIEFGLPRLSDQDLILKARPIGQALFQAATPWETDSILDRLQVHSLAVERLASGLRPVLERVARRNKETTRWRALGLESRFGLSPTTVIRARNLARVFSEVVGSKLPFECAPLALKTFGSGAPRELAKRIRVGRSETQNLLLRLAVEIDEPEVNQVLIDLLEQPGDTWSGRKKTLRLILSKLAGSDLGPTPKAWRTWLKERR